MNKVTSISEMLKFHFGSKVICSDGDYGVLTHVLFDPTTRRMTQFGLKQGRLFGKSTQLPFDTILSASSDGITVSLTIEDVNAANKPASASGNALLSSKSVVENLGTASKGVLALIAVHPNTGELAYLVAHHLIPGKDTLLKAAFVTDLATERVAVSIDGTTLNALSPYRPDNVLQQEVEATLFDLTPLHVDMKTIVVRVLDSVLYLEGNISSALRGDMVVDQALGVPGILEIKNNLVADDTLASDLARALGKDERTREVPIGIYPRLGVVRLRGAVHTGQQKAAAEEIVRNFPGVRSVINDLSINSKADMLHVMSPAGGDEDILPNKYTRHTQ
jgi:osmotically-inducible protein OsmY